MRNGEIPSAWKVGPRIARSRETSIVARSSSGSDSSRASRFVPSARAMVRSSVSLGSRFPFSIIDNWLGARSTAAARSSRVIRRSVRNWRMRLPMVSVSMTSSSSVVIAGSDSSGAVRLVIAPILSQKRNFV